MKRHMLRFDYHRLTAPRNMRAAALAEQTGGQSEGRVLQRPRDMGLRDWAVYSLHNAAVVEHALMVQYLYAAYSLDVSARQKSDPSKNASTWLRTIVAIAVEEMGHLMTIQNILRFVGGPICFDRGDFPIETQIYPFPFRLERLTKQSLAKYVYAEMPAGPVDAKVISAEERAKIEATARSASTNVGATFTNHVGTLYATLIDVFADPAFTLQTSSGFSTTAATFQQDPNHFESQRLLTNDSIAMASPNLLGPRLLTVNSLADVRSALSFIASQGESTNDNPTDSHFERFLKIFREYPDDPSTWTKEPSFAVASNPTAGLGGGGATVIDNPITQLWARLFDLRYRMLLTALAHAASLPVLDGQPATAAREKTLVDWIFNGFMKRSATLGISSLAMILAKLPRGAAAADGTSGAPFGMPYSMAIPDQERDRWQLHSDLIGSETDLINAIRAKLPEMGAGFEAFPEPAAALDELEDAERERATSIAEVMKA